MTESTLDPNRQRYAAVTQPDDALRLNDEAVTQKADAGLNRLLSALEAPPLPRIPADFAARVAAEAAAESPPRRRTVRAHAPMRAANFASIRPAKFGVLVTHATPALLLLSMLILAPMASVSSKVLLILECLLCAEFVLITLWLSLRSNGAI